MKKNIINTFLSVIVLLLTATISNAQSVNNYSVTRSTGNTYVSIADIGNSISTWRNTAQYSQDDNRSFPNNIGFDFWYNGVRYTQFSVSTNGFIDFSFSTADGTGTNAFGYSNTRFSSSTSTSSLTVAPMYDDLMAQGGQDALGNSIKYISTGTAPNRVLTVEWRNLAVYGNTTPDINFQVKLYETSGLIEFVYGTMTAGTTSYSYSCGINGPTISSSPTAAQLKTQQTANTSTFSNTARNNLSTIPATNSKITLTPVSPSGTFNGTVTINGIGKSTMTLNYNNWCGNEIGYAIYRSTDNVNFDFIIQNAANSTTYSATDLDPNTTYYWKIFAITEGSMSSAATGNATTTAAGNITSTGSGSWNTSGSWTPSGVPTATDNVTILNGHTITINSDATCNNLTIGGGSSGSLVVGNSTTARSLTINGNLTINNGASIVSGSSDAIHTATISGNIINNGTLNFRPTASRVVNTTFNNNINQTISGTGATTNFNLITLNKGNSSTNVLDVISTNFDAPDNFLTLTNGTFKLSSTNSIDRILFSNIVTFNETVGLHLNNSNATLRLNGGLSLFGYLTVQAGTVHIGDADNENLESKGGHILVNGGNLLIASRFFSTDINNLTDFAITSGTFTVPSVSSSSASVYPFQINATGSTFNMEGGTIIIPSEGGSGGQDLGVYIGALANNTISGGTLQFGNSNTPSNQTFKFYTTSALANMRIHNANTRVNMLTDLEVYDSLRITQGTFDPSNFNVTLGGQWVNTGSFIEGTSTVTFNGTADQFITSTNGETFYNLTVNKTSNALKLGTDTVSIINTLSLQDGQMTTNNRLVLLSNTTSTARIAEITNGSISGDVIAQRYMPGGSNKRKWRYLSSPVNVGGSISLTQFIDDIIVTGAGGATNGFDNSPTNNPSIRTYDETVTGVVDNGWVAPANINTSYSTATGFEVFGRGSRATPNPFDPTSVPLDATIDMIGAINQGNITKNLSYTNTGLSAADGFNLVGNPYPSQIDFNAAGMVKTNILNRFWVYNPNNGAYGVYDAALNEGTNGITRYISSGQSFFVKATSTGASIGFVESVKTSNTPFTYFREPKKSNNVDQILRLKVQRDSLTYDESIIVYRQGASKADIDESDAGKFFNDQLNLYSKSSNGTNLAINIFPLPEVTDTIKISLFAYNGTSSPWDGTYTISFNIDNNLDFDLVLVDYYLGTFTKIDNDKKYIFEITSNPLSMGNNRFAIISTRSLTNIENNIYIKESEAILFPNPANDLLTVQLNKYKNDETCQAKIYDQRGMLILSDVFDIKNSMLDIDVSKLDKGVYILRLEKESGEWTGKFTKN